MIVLYGAGTSGRVIARELIKKAQMFVFADNDPLKQGTLMEGVQVYKPLDAFELYPDALWIASVVRPERREIMFHIVELGVRTEPVWNWIPTRRGLPPEKTQKMLLEMTADAESWFMLKDQYEFRKNPDYDCQRQKEDINEVYFPEFIRKREDEHFIDCGAADGDTVREVRKRWPKYGHITAFEPDLQNYIKLTQYYCELWDSGHGNHLTVRHYALGSHHQKGVPFVATGDQSACLGEGKARVELQALDNFTYTLPPTFIKMDIEGAELDALWGARKIIREHAPVLAVCAYHKSEDLWEIPLLMHTLNPEYKLYFRRYAEGAWEIVWYAVPPERVL